MMQVCFIALCDVINKYYNYDEMGNRASPYMILDWNYITTSYRGIYAA
jgi:hypothetical protein